MENSTNQSLLFLIIAIYLIAVAIAFVDAVRTGDFEFFWTIVLAPLVLAAILYMAATILALIFVS